MNFLKRCWQKRWVRGLAWTAVTLVTLYALFCAWVNWSGARQWRAAQARLKAEGETLDFRATLNEPVPEAENFCAIPLLKDLALLVDHDGGKGAPGANRKRLEALKLQSKGNAGEVPKVTNAVLGKRTDLKAWADWLRKEGALPMPADGDGAREVLAALATHDALVQELAAGLDRPQAQWTPEWKTKSLPPFLAMVELPHYASVQALNSTLALRAIAAARTGDAAKAHETVLIIARLDQACFNDPFLIGQLVGAAGTSMLCGATWELCAAHAGTAEDFTKLEFTLANLDLHRAVLRACRSEMASNVDIVQYFKERPSEIPGLVQMSSSGLQSQPSGADWLMHLVPGGFFDASAALLADLQFRHIIKPLKDGDWPQALTAAHDLENELKAMKPKVWTHPSYIMAAIIVPATKGILSRCIYSQALMNQAVIACALERHRIEKRSYPDSLDAVRLADGKLLPPDPMNGTLRHYRKTLDGRYAMWSVGFDGKDDGGKRVLNEKQPENTRFHDATYVGDWVWDFPAE